MTIYIALLRHILSRETKNLVVLGGTADNYADAARCVSTGSSSWATLVSIISSLGNYLKIGSGLL